MSRADTSDPEIKAAIDELKAGGTNWYAPIARSGVTLVDCPLCRLLLGYVPKSDSKLRVADKGTGGFKELNNEFNDGKVLFALCTFESNNIKKYVYVAWCGEGVIGMKKGLFNNHSQDVAALLKVCPLIDASTPPMFDTTCLLLASYVAQAPVTVRLFLCCVTSFAATTPA